MVRITFITPAGATVTVKTSSGTLMTAAVENQVEGIDGDCGGVCSCATCHVHVDREWSDRVGPAGKEEAAMLELDDRATNTSRLGCQVPIRPDLDGLTVRVVGR